MNSTVYKPGPPAGMTMSPRMAIRQHVLSPKPVAQKNPQAAVLDRLGAFRDLLGMLLRHLELGSRMRIILGGDGTISEKTGASWSSGTRAHPP